jgi:hypothetical protein
MYHIVQDELDNYLQEQRRKGSGDNLDKEDPD